MDKPDNIRIEVDRKQWVRHVKRVCKRNIKNDAKICKFCPLRRAVMATMDWEIYEPPINLTTADWHGGFKMLRITVELVPYGIEEKAQVIAKGKIWNTGTGTPQIGAYKSEIYLDSIDNMEKPWLCAEVKEFHRQKWNVWHLVRDVLVASLGRKKK